MILFGYTLVKEMSQGPKGPLVSFDFENEDAVLCIGEDEDGTWFGFVHIGQSELNAFGQSAEEVHAALVTEAALVHAALGSLLKRRHLDAPEDKP